MHIFLWALRKNVILLLFLIAAGKDFARENYLLPMTNGFDDSYDQYLNPTTTTSFTSAAFRSLHSSIPGFIE